MNKLFLDTSAFIKLYRLEKGSTWLKSFITSNDIIVSRLAVYESINTFARLQRDGLITSREALDLYRQMQRDKR